MTTPAYLIMNLNPGSQLSLRRINLGHKQRKLKMSTCLAENIKHKTRST